MKERLIELIKNAPRLTFAAGGRLQGRTYQTVSNIAKHLLANGVIVPPCKVGDVLYYLANFGDELFIDEIRVTEVGTKHIFASAYKDDENDIQDVYVYSDLGESLFFAREEAEKKLRDITRRRNNEGKAD